MINKSIDSGHIKFISYTGKYPNLCSGVLTLDVTDGEWLIDFDEIPDCFKKYAEEIGETFNTNVPYGCCGGCI